MHSATWRSPGSASRPAVPARSSGARSPARRGPLRARVRRRPHVTSGDGDRVRAERTTPDPNRSRRPRASAGRRGHGPRALGPGTRPVRLGPHPEYVLVPASWHLPGRATAAASRSGRSRHGTLAAIRVTNLSAAPVMSEAGVAFARAFPDPVLGLWARGSAPIPEHRPAEAVVNWAEEQIARAHRGRSASSTSGCDMK